VEQLIQNGRVVRGYLGVSISDVNTALAKQLGLPEPAGALIARVEADSPAAKAGLQPGDVVIGLDGREVPDSATFRTRIATLPAGTQVELTYYREGKKDKLQATIGEFPILLTLGLSLRDLSGEAADRLPGSPERAVIIEEVVPNSRADQVGLRPGMRIVAVNGRPVATKAEANAIADALPPDAGVPLRIQLRDGREADVLVGGPPPRRRRR
ncbi:MAG: PDZ domain-containing protein, partial [Isosphaeraceae bacterium]|nr:PDZ domain-containing protein [Isosphaeraceae bacterium]